MPASAGHWGTDAARSRPHANRVSQTRSSSSPARSSSALCQSDGQSGPRSPIAPVRYPGRRPSAAGRPAVRSGGRTGAREECQYEQAPTRRASVIRAARQRMWQAPLETDVPNRCRTGGQRGRHTPGAPCCCPSQVLPEASAHRAPSPVRALLWGPRRGGQRAHAEAPHSASQGDVVWRVLDAVPPLPTRVDDAVEVSSSKTCPPKSPAQNALSVCRLAASNTTTLRTRFMAVDLTNRRKSREKTSGRVSDPERVVRR
jgi:hypothetical protein